MLSADVIAEEIAMGVAEAMARIAGASLEELAGRPHAMDGIREMRESLTEVFVGFQRDALMSVRVLAEADQYPSTSAYVAKLVERLLERLPQGSGAPS